MTATLAAPPAHALADLVLVRMSLPGKKPAGPKKVRDDVGKLLGTALSETEFDDLRNELAADGFLARGKRNTFTVTDAGNERALRFLGIEALPPRASWSALIARHLFPRAAGLSLHAAEKLNNGDKLAAFLLERKYGLSAGAGTTVSQVLEALACQRLGFHNETTLNGVLCVALSELMGAERLTKEQLAKQLPLFETGLTAGSAEAIRQKVVRDWLAGAEQPPRKAPEPPPPGPEPFDLPAFAETVRALASGSPPQDRFHDNKAFIAPLWRASQREPSFPRLSLDEFKQRLIEANAQRLLHLSRADLVQEMDPQLVADSETHHLNATFHFVLIEGGRS